MYSHFLRRIASDVTAYEPSPDLADRLQRALPKVRVRSVAVSNKLGETTFSIPIDAGGRLDHELGSVGQVFEGALKQFNVETVTLDSEGFANVGFIKIDVEQHEREVLQGALHVIERCRPVMLVEVYPLKYQRPLLEEFEFILGR